MARVVVDEQGAPAAPAAGTGVFYVRNTAPNAARFVDDTNVDLELTRSDRGTSLPSPVPSRLTFFLLDGGAGVADILYASMKRSSDDTFQWVEVVRAP